MQKVYFENLFYRPVLQTSSRSLENDICVRKGCALKKTGCFEEGVYFSKALGLPARRGLT